MMRPGSVHIDHAVSLVSLSCGREPWTHKLHLVESISWTRPITVCSPSPVHSLVSVLSRPTPIFNLNPMPIDQQRSKAPSLLQRGMPVRCGLRQLVTPMSSRSTSPTILARLTSWWPC